MSKYEYKFPEILNNIMVKNNLTTNDISKLALVTVPTIRNYLKNKTKPSTTTVMELASKLNMSVGELCLGVTSSRSGFNYNLPSEVVIQLANHNMTQERLAKLIGVCDRSVNKWVTYRGIPLIIHAIKIAEVFDISLDQLVYGR